jgi:hypothetical protein
MTKEKCFQSDNVSGVCDVCSEPAKKMHLPVRPLGFYCHLHCPVCSNYFDVLAVAARKTGVCVSIRVEHNHCDETPAS